jgi:hypothetical protein
MCRIGPRWMRALSPISTTGIHKKTSARRQAAIAIPTRATPSNARANVRKVRLVPMAGIRASVGRNVPRMLPTVEMAYILPETLPEVSLSWIASRMAKGDTVPSSVTGTANSTIITPNEPISTAAFTFSTARAAICKTGRPMIGTNPPVNAPQAITR